MKTRFSDDVVRQARALRLSVALQALADQGRVFWRYDRDFVPVKSGATVRVYVSSPGGRAWELVVTGMKWFDTRAGIGGGGAIDLVQHLCDADFREAVRLLQAAAMASTG